MEGYIVSVKNNTLRVSLAGTDQVAEKQVAADLSSHEVLAEELGALILESFGPKPKKLPLNFLVGPEDLHLNFLTVTKGNSDEEKLIEQAKSKLGAQGVAIENLYFTHQKIAPFVYQLVAIEQDKLEKYLQIATDLELELKSVIPWVLLLPRHNSNSGEPVIFVLNVDETKHLVLSELGGIYHLGLLDNTKSAQDLEELIQKLSVYQRNTPITNIYTLNMKDLNLGEKYTVSSLEIDDLHTLVAEAFADPAVFNTQLNLLTLLPVPEVAKQTSPMIYVGGVIGALLLVGTFFGVRELQNRADESQLALNAEETPVVLSEVEESSESTDTTNTTEESEAVPDLDRAFLSIRVENGTSIGGLAGRTRDHLSELGYEVVGVGDAEESDRVATLVNISGGNVLYKDLLLEDLQQVFGSIEVQEDLESELGYDVLIVAGSDDGTADESSEE